MLRMRPASALVLAVRRRVALFTRVSRAFANRKQSLEDDGCAREGGLLYYWRHRTQPAGWISQVLSYFLPPPSPGTLILVRHGESEWNSAKKFTGWTDVDLNQRGKREVEHAARLLLERGYSVDVTYTSLLKRAIRSAWILNREIHQIYRPVVKSWRLNERCYGALEGCSKPALALEVGEEQVQRWRRGVEERPPPMNDDHPHWHAGDRKYKHLDPKVPPARARLNTWLFIYPPTLPTPNGRRA